MGRVTSRSNDSLRFSINDTVAELGESDPPVLVVPAKIDVLGLHCPARPLPGPGQTHGPGQPYGERTQDLLQLTVRFYIISIHKKYTRSAANPGPQTTPSSESNAPLTDERQNTSFV